MGYVDRPLETVEITEGEVNVIIGCRRTTWKFKQINSGTVGTVWNCPTGSQIHLQTLLVSSGGAGEAEIRTSRKGTICMLEFNEKKTVPLPIVSETKLGTTNHLTAAWTPDAAGSLWVTAIGHMHTG